MWIKSHSHSKGSCTIFIRLSQIFLLQLKYLSLLSFFSINTVVDRLLRVLLLSTGSTARCSRGGFCPLHQPVPWLRAPDADGASIALPLFPGNHGWIQRWVTFPSGYINEFFFPCILRHLSSLQYFSVLSMRYKVYYWFELVCCAWCFLEMSRAKNELQRTPTFMDLYQEMEAMFVKQSAGMSHISYVYLGHLIKT